MDIDTIKSQIGYDNAEVRQSDNGAFLWLNISQDGVSYNARLPLEPKQHHLDDVKQGAAKWFGEQE